VGAKGPYGGGGGGSVPSDVYASFKITAGFTFSTQTTGSGGDLTGAGGTFSVSVNTGITYSGSPTGTFTVVTSGYYMLMAGACIRCTPSTNSNVLVGVRINSGSIIGVRWQSNSAVTFNPTSVVTIQQLAVGDTVKIGYYCTALSTSSTVYVEEGYLTMFKMVQP
jgi:hypothetical protein